MAALRLLHPDKLGPNVSVSDQVRATAIFTKIQAAWQDHSG